MKKMKMASDQTKTKEQKKRKRRQAYHGNIKTIMENSAKQQSDLFFNDHTRYHASGASIKTGAKIKINVLFLLFNVCLKNVYCADVTTKCPQEFSETTIQYVECIVNRAVIDAASCTVRPTSINIGFERPSDSPLSLSMCISPPVYPCTSPVSKPTVPGDCACTIVNGNELTYTLAFAANSTTDKGAKFVCQICTGPPLVRFSENCDSIKFTPPVVPAPDHTVRNILLGVLIPVGVIVIVVVIVVVIWKKKWKYPKRQGHTQATRDKTEKPLREALKNVSTADYCKA